MEDRQDPLQTNRDPGEAQAEADRLLTEIHDEMFGGTQDYYETYLDTVADSLRLNSQIKGFTAHSGLLGAFAESAVRQLVARTLAPARCSTGSIVSPVLHGQSANSRNHLRQLDVVVWEPYPLPAVFESHEFALVPTASVLAVLEVKRSAYSRDCLLYTSDAADD